MEQTCANPECGKPLGVCAGAPAGVLTFCGPGCAEAWCLDLPHLIIYTPPTSKAAEEIKEAVEAYYEAAEKARRG
jgi:hypothetical protein